MNLRNIRRSRNVTQHQLAKLVGVSDSVISKYEKGLIIPPTDKLEKIAHFLDVTIDYLLGDDYADYVIGNDIMDFSIVEKSIRERAQKELTLHNGKTDNYKDSLDKVIIYDTDTLRDILLKRTDGHCELCGNSAPFVGIDGKPYLETHFIKWLSKGGSASINNLVVLCPNCRQKVLQLNLPGDIQKLTEIASKHEKV